MQRRPVIEQTTLKIKSVKIEPVARIFAILYFAFGFVYFFSVSLHRTDNITFPLGVLAPLVYLNLNFTFPRSTEVFGAAIQLACCLFSYCVTGWVTGAAFIICLNFIAKRFGGISARFVNVEKPQPQPDLILTPSTDNRQ